MVKTDEEILKELFNNKVYQNINTTSFKEIKDIVGKEIINDFNNNNIYHVNYKTNLLKAIDDINSLLNNHYYNLLSKQEELGVYENG